MSTSLFVKPDATIKIDFWIGTHNGQLAGAIDEEGKIDGVEYAKHTATFRQPNYRDITSLSDKALVLNQEGNYIVNVNQVRLSRIAMLIEEWTLTDDNGKIVPATMQTIEMLNPVVAYTIAAGLENALGIDNEEVIEEAVESPGTE